MNAYQRALRDFQDFADDVSRARHRTFQDAIQRFASCLAPLTPLGDIAAQLPVVVFAEWYQRQRETVGGMVGSGHLEWPERSRERLSMQVELVRALASKQVDILEFTRNFMWLGNSYDDNTAEFIQQIFRPFVRDVLRLVHDTPAFEAGLRARTLVADQETPVEEELTLFISHSTADAAIAKEVILLFQKSLKISARRIRCTSVDGYRLPAGADTNEVLRTEVFGAKLFIALLTPTSIASPYVLFELGARWGARKPLFPLLAGGATPAYLRSPLSGLNALSASSPDQVRQLIEDASASLSERMEPMATFSAEIDELVAVSSRDSSPEAPSA